MWLQKKTVGYSGFSPDTYHLEEIAPMQTIVQLDDMDARILTVLAIDSRRSYAEVGAEVGLSTAAVHERVKKMIERGVIERFTLRINPERVGLHFTAFVLIRNEAGVHCGEIASRLREIPELLELHSVAGEYDELAKIRTTHAQALEEVLYRIKAIAGIARTTSTVVLSTVFEERAAPMMANASATGKRRAGAA
jgi:Lrp/AsnC family transcriptional regulator, leucine-responsive regulatory protein